LESDRGLGRRGRVARQVRQLPTILVAGLIPLLNLSARPEEQTHFGMEEHVRHPIALPEAALALVAGDPDVKSVIEDHGPAGAPLLITWLSASYVHLDGPNERDIIVVGKGPLSGANITTFWVLRPSGTGFDMLLNVPAHDLIVKRRRSKGYRDIEAWSATAVTVSSVSFRFDGSQYKPAKRALKPIP
jgi:hypothetical protein